jgi:anti-anti-sigma regulatory factor
MHNGAIMPSEVRHLVDADQTYPLVRLTGVLDTETAPGVRSALLGVLAGQPEAVVVDVGQLDVAQPEAVGVLRQLHRDTADWPAAHLALCDPRDSGVWQDSGWPVWPDRDGAFAALGTPHRDRRLSLGMAPEAGAARRSRELISDACDRWDRPGLSGSASIVATEMVNNVVAHAQTPMIFLLAAHGAGLSVAVRDESATVPSFTGGPVSPTAYGGRGMLLIDSVAARWGSLVLADGKVVWALLAAEEETPPAAPHQRDSAGMADPARG